jgi:hypothetical protein
MMVLKRGVKAVREELWELERGLCGSVRDSREEEKPFFWVRRNEGRERRELAAAGR